MGALTSPHAAIVECAEPLQESLAERLARGPLVLADALRYAICIATALRDMHHHGLTFGAVSSHLIVLDSKGASLRNTSGLKRLGDGKLDVSAFGAVLTEMLRRAEIADSGAQRVCEEARQLAVRCGDESPRIQQVLIALRLLTMQTRQPLRQFQVVPRPVLAPQPALVEPTPIKSEKTPRNDRVRIRLRLSLQWKPLINLAAASFSES